MTRNPFSQYQTNQHTNYVNFAESLRGVFETFINDGGSVAKLQEYLNTNKILSFYGKPWSHSATSRVVSLLGIKTHRGKKLAATWEKDKHLGCPAYPNCDIDPNGCLFEMDDDNDVEWYGHKD